MSPSLLRTTLALIAAAMLAIPTAVEAQPRENVYRVGLLLRLPAGDPGSLRIFTEFVDGLRELGYVEGRNLTLERRSTQGSPEQARILADELVRLKVDVIVTGGDREVEIAKQATRTIPIVMAVSGDPVRSGFVSSLARPGGNVTGLSFVSPELSPKLLEILKEAVPNVRDVAAIWNAGNPVKRLDFDETQRAARALGVTLHSAEFKTPADLAASFATVTRVRPQALVILIDEVLNQTDVFTAVEEFALKHRLPSISGERRHADAGGLISYGPNTGALFRRAATYVDKILKGAKPADLPIEQPTKFQLVVNLRTAKALGISVPASLLVRADQVIE